MNGWAFNVQKSAEKSIFAVLDTWDSNTCKYCLGRMLDVLKTESVIVEAIRKGRKVSLSRDYLMAL